MCIIENCWTIINSTGFYFSIGYLTSPLQLQLRLCIQENKFFHTKPWILGSEKSIFTVVIHWRRLPLCQFACARRIDEYDLTMPVPHIQLMSQINRGDITMLSQNKANLRDLIAATGLVISNWIKIVNFYARVTVKFDGWPRKTK